MDKIKGKVICKIAEILSEMDTDNPDEGIKAIKQILAIEEIAVVDREAKLPYPHTVVYAFYRKLLSEENWVKEIRE